MANRRREQGQGSMFQYPGCKRWVIQYYVDGQRKREATGITSRQEAQKILHARLTAVAKGEPITIKAVRVEECYPLLLRSKRWINQPQKAAGLAMRWKHLQPFFGAMLASRITPAVVDQYRAQRIAKGVSHATVDRELTYLRAMLRAAYKERVLATAPYIPLSGADNKRTGFASDSQLEALRQAAGNTGELWLRTVVELASVCGTRRANLLGLTVTQCDFEAGLVRLEKTKNGHALELPMTAAIRALLEQGCTGKKKPDAAVLTRNDGTVVRDPRVAWWALCCTAGLGAWHCRTKDCGTVQTSRTRCPKCNLYNWKYRGLLLHDLRRTAVRNLRQAGVSEQVAMTITGHRTPAVFKRYDIVNNDDKRTALQQLSEFKVALKTAQQPEVRAAKVQ